MRFCKVKFKSKDLIRFKLLFYEKKDHFIGGTTYIWTKTNWSQFKSSAKNLWLEQKICKYVKNSSFKVPF